MFRVNIIYTCIIKKPCRVSHESNDFNQVKYGYYDNHIVHKMRLIHDFIMWDNVIHV